MYFESFLNFTLVLRYSFLHLTNTFWFLEKLSFVIFALAHPLILLFPHLLEETRMLDCEIINFGLQSLNIFVSSATIWLYLFFVCISLGGGYLSLLG